MALSEAEWRWLIERALDGHPQKQRVMLARYVQRLPIEAVAAELGITVKNAKVQIYQSWTRFTLHPWKPSEVEYVQELIDRGEVDDPERPETRLQHARGILAAMRQPVSAPPTPTFDELGRQVGCRSPVVDIEDLTRYMDDEQAYREQVIWTTVPPTDAERRRIGPYRGEQAIPDNSS